MNEKNITIEEFKTAILEWWKTYKCNSIRTGFRGKEEYIIYDEEPKFVTLAKKLNE